MNIDFIKWMVGYAEGFDIRIWTSGTYEIVTNDRVYNRGNSAYKTLVYPLLLQRAIEGVNDSEKYRWKAPILQNRGYVEVVNRKDVIVGGTDAETYDQAKEQALKYIYEQETK